MVGGGRWRWRFCGLMRLWWVVKGWAFTYAIELADKLSCAVVKGVGRKSVGNRVKLAIGLRLMRWKFDALVKVMKVDALLDQRVCDGPDARNCRLRGTQSPIVSVPFGSL